MNTHITRFARALLAGASLVLAQSALAADPVEGTNYKPLKPPQPTNVAPGKVEVVEVFWYACGHCYLLEPKIASWDQKERPAYVQLIRLPATWNTLLKTHARIFYTVEALGKMSTLHDEVFREINVRGNRLDTPDKIEAFFVSKGVSKQDFQKAFNSFAVESNIRRAEDLNKRYRITSTPTFIVNGKYVTDAGMNGSEAQLFTTIDALAAKEKPQG